MKLSELIAELTTLYAEHGDCVVTINDADTNWKLKLSGVHFFEAYDEMPDQVCLAGDYEDQL